MEVTTYDFLQCNLSNHLNLCWIHDVTTLHLWKKVNLPNVRTVGEEAPQYHAAQTATNVQEHTVTNILGCFR
jgi:hypothetical protein